MYNFLDFTERMRSIKSFNFIEFPLEVRYREELEHWSRCCVRACSVSYGCMWRRLQPYLLCSSSVVETKREHNGALISGVGYCWSLIVCSLRSNRRASVSCRAVWLQSSSKGSNVPQLFHISLPSDCCLNNRRMMIDDKLIWRYKN